MSFIKKLFLKWKNNREKNNNLCDEYILRINAAMEEFKSILTNSGLIEITEIIAWKEKNAALIDILRSRDIKKLKKAKKYQELVSFNESFQKNYNEAKSIIFKHNKEILEKRVDDGYEIIGDVEGKKIDRQQMECVVNDSYNHLVVAGAGTGKTTTIVAKVKYLINSKKCLPNEILVLSFTNATASEMKNRIKKETGEDIDASTFHKLGLNIITAVDKITPNISNLKMFSFIKEQIKLNMQKNEYLNLLNLYLLYNRVFYKSEFEFKTLEEYEEYLKLNQPTTIKNEIVKSYGEMDIANFLHQNSVEYIYESLYEKDTRTDEYGQYKPDFYLPEYGIYIEYFGIDREGNVPPYFKSKHGKDPSEEYQDSIKWKRNLHKKNNTILLECYAYEKIEGELLDNLEKNLIKAGVKLNKKSASKLWNENSNKDDYLDIVIELLQTVINLLKSNNYSLEELKRLSNASSHFKDNNILIALLEPIYNAYNSYLKEHNEIDFNDMIIVATEYVKTQKYVSNYKYVIIDEYQDISKSRFNLINSMRVNTPFKLFCVGDDWQSIYRFTGSDINYILNFEHYWGYSDKSKIENTYRFNQDLIDVSSGFIMQNPLQIRKNLHGTNTFNGIVIGEIVGYTEKTAIDFMIAKLEDLPKDSNVFFIGRYSSDIKILEENSFLECKYNNQNSNIDVRYSKRLDLKMEFLTAHKSKGLQADYVFIINNKKSKMGFPSKIQDPPILELLLDNCEPYLFSEERRLFYVAMTRAKKKVFFLTVNGQESIFIDEIRKKWDRELKQEKYECPLCGGKLSKRNGKYGEFFGCENYKRNGCKYTRNIIKR